MSTETKMMVLKSNDGEEFEVEEAVAMMSRTLKGIIEDDCADNAIPVSNVTAGVLGKVLEYCKKHVAGGDDSDESLKKWDEEFMKRDLRETMELLLAANYLDIKGLLDLASQTIAEFIKDLPVEKVRDIFNVVNDYSPEEEAKVKAENAWAFE